MLEQQRYVAASLESHMFFARIMKEHSIFLEAGFTPANSDRARTADRYKEQFETILQNAVILGNGIIRPEIAVSGELFTDYTLGSEQKTQKFTGIAINQGITRMEDSLYGAVNPKITPDLTRQVKQLNANTRALLDGLIEFKTRTLDDALSCDLFTLNYPLLIDHLLREAKMYMSHLAALESGRNPDEDIKETELFWDQIMLEHALFIRGLLDPTENDLIRNANNFANEYTELLRKAQNATDMTIQGITKMTLQKTLEYRDFKVAGTRGIAECKIRSVILPLLADHVLRESNHFIRLLKQFA